MSSPTDDVYRPGIDCPDKPYSPTQFHPEKPAGPDPITPPPSDEGSEYDKHAQLYALDPASGLFKPCLWKNGKLQVDTELSDITVTLGSININPTGDVVNIYDEAPLVAVGAATPVVQYVVPVGKTFWFKHAEFGGQNFGVYRLKIGAVVHATVRTHDGSGLTGRIDWDDEIDTPGGLSAAAGDIVSIEVVQNGYVPSDHEGRIYGRLI